MRACAFLLLRATTLLAVVIAPVDGTRFPLPDPCTWRHTWLYRVTPDGQVALLFDEGDPDR